MIRHDPRQFDLFAAVTPAPVVAATLARMEAEDAASAWALERAAIDRARAATPPEVLTWGKRTGTKYLEIALLRDGDAWRVRMDHAMPNMGSSGPFGPAVHASRDAALTYALGRQLGRIARHLAACNGSISYGKDSDWQALARWCIAQAPTVRGGSALAAEYAGRKATLTARNQLRMAACRAGARDYVGEDGTVRPVTCL